MKSRYEELENRYHELEKLSQVPRTVYEAKEVEVEKPIYTRIGQEVEKLMDMKHSKDKAMMRQVLFSLLFYQGGYAKYFRLASRCSHGIKETRRSSKASSTSTSTVSGSSTSASSIGSWFT